MQQQASSGGKLHPPTSLRVLWFRPAPSVVSPAIDKPTPATNRCPREGYPSRDVVFRLSMCPGRRKTSKSRDSHPARKRQRKTAQQSASFRIVIRSKKRQSGEGNRDNSIDEVFASKAGGFTVNTKGLAWQRDAIGIEGSTRLRRAPTMSQMRNLHQQVMVRSQALSYIFLPFVMVVATQRRSPGIDRGWFVRDIDTVGVAAGAQFACRRVARHGGGPFRRLVASVLGAAAQNPSDQQPWRYRLGASSDGGHLTCPLHLDYRQRYARCSAGRKGSTGQRRASRAQSNYCAQ
jgi:hypothetical protein